MADAFVRITVDGRALEVSAHAMLASGLWGDGVASLHTSPTGEPRGALCGMGTCFECRVTVDGTPHVRACLTPCRDGMTVTTTALSPAETHREPGPPRRADHDILVVGAGPAGMAAATAAARGTGLRVGIVDENPMPGGQIWRAAPSRPPPTRRARELVAAAQDAGVVVHTSASVVAVPASGELLAVDDRGALRITHDKLILATGARELFLPFPGWTLPGVLGAGGLQALVKGGYDVRGKRVIVAGSGPLLLAVAGTLRAAGAHLECVVEQAPASRLARLALHLVGRPAKLMQAAGLERRLLGSRRHFGGCPVSAAGDGVLQRVTLEGDGWRSTLDCDLLACGFGLVPNSTVARHLGCELAGGGVLVDQDQLTSVPGVFAAGEVTGVCGVEGALLEGRIAGLAAAGREPDERRTLAAARGRWQRFAAALHRAYELGPRALDLCRDATQTVLCRCEDVPIGAALACADARDAKLRTRCGMGACQGRVCGDALHALRGWEPTRPRPPLTPVRLGLLAQLAGDPGRPEGK